MESLFRTTRKRLLQVAATSSDGDLSLDSLSHVFVHAEVVPHALVPAFLRSETLLFLFSPFMQHTRASPLSLLLPILIYSLALYSQTRFPYTLCSGHSHVFLQTVLLKLSVLLPLSAPLVRTHFSFSRNSRKRY